jgi:hypothetical protein
MFEVRSAFAEKAEKSASVVVREVELSDAEDSMSTRLLTLILYNDTDASQMHLSMSTSLN